VAALLVPIPSRYGAGFIPTNLYTLLDGAIQVSKDEAYDFTRRAAKEEGMLVGISSGASLAAVAKKLSEIPENAKVPFFTILENTI
jgi:cysteine synthase A